MFAVIIQSKFSFVLRCIGKTYLGSVKAAFEITMSMVDSWRASKADLVTAWPKSGEKRSAWIATVRMEGDMASIDLRTASAEDFRVEKVIAMAIQPFRASSTAMPAPIPLEPPVMMADLPASGAGIVSHIVIGLDQETMGST